MKNFYIADLHIGHENILRLDNRPFSDLNEMHRAMIDNWNSAVRGDDTVYILGDFCWGKEEMWLQCVSVLAGKKVLVLGNHDLKQFSPILKRQFQEIVCYKEISDSGKHIIMSHYAIPFHKADYNPDCYMLYGHVHTTRENDMLNQLRDSIRASCTEKGHAIGNFINVGCMMPWMDYTPRTLDEIIERSGITNNRPVFE